MVEVGAVDAPEVALRKRRGQVKANHFGAERGVERADGEANCGDNGIEDGGHEGLIASCDELILGTHD
jgi:hypothetical protein